MRIIIGILINAVAFILTSMLLQNFGFYVENFWPSAVLAAIVLGVLNTFIRPVLQLLALPLTIITLGLFALVVNAIVLWIVPLFVPGVIIDGFLPAFLGAIVLSVISTILSSVLGDVKKAAK